MNNYQAIREAAWKRLISEEVWIGRFLATSIFLALTTQFVQNLLNACYKLCNIQSFSECKLQLWKQILKNQSLHGLTLPSLETTLPVFCLDTFFTLIFQGIIAAGITVLTLRALRRNDERWFSASLLGWRNPIEWAWILFRYTLLFLIPFLIVFFSALLLVNALRCFLPEGPIQQVSFILIVVLAVIVCLVMWVRLIYRYRYLFFVKVDNPMLSVGDCMRKCRALTKGHLKESFYLDCSYWRTLLILLVSVLLIGASAFMLQTDDKVLAVLSIAFLVLSSLIFVVVLFFVTIYIRLGQSFLYEKLITAADEESQTKED